MPTNISKPTRTKTNPAAKSNPKQSSVVQEDISTQAETQTAQPFWVQVNQAFDVQAPDGFVIEGFSADSQHPAIPVKNEHYVFRKEELRDVLAFLSNPDGDALYVTGHSGSGKTSLICQVASRLNWAVEQVTVHGRMEFSDLIGHMSLVNGNMEFVDGALTRAVKNGHILILNEIDLADPAELAGLNDLLEGSPLVIAHNGGEVIYPHPKFRFVATGNSIGSGDQTGLYQGVMQQNLAFLDRFRVLEVKYAEAEIEKQILQRVAPSLPEVFQDKMIQVANTIRRLFMGSDTSGAELSVTMSTRTLMRWAKLTLAFKGAPNAVEYALIRALTAKAEPEQRAAIHRITADVFGDHWQS